MDRFSCKHDPSIAPISYWCSSGCWEAQGMSSKFIEHYMKGIKAVGRLGDCMPIDVPDFERCIEILNIHPEWISRLPEMKRRSINWRRLIDNWDTFVMLLNDLPHIKTPTQMRSDYSPSDKQKYSYFNYLIQGITKDHCLLKKYNLRCESELINFRLKEHLVVGSHVLQEKNQDNEYDIYPCAVFDIFPDVMCKTFKTDGNVDGWMSARSYLPVSHPTENTQNTQNDNDVSDNDGVNNNSNTQEKKITEIESELVSIIENEIKKPIETDTEPVNTVSKITIHYDRYCVEDTPQFRKQQLMKKIHDRMEQYVQHQPETWRTTNFHYCPHYVLYAPGENVDNETQYEMYVANVYPLVETQDEWQLGMCLISMSSSHPLHPSQKKTRCEADEEECDVIYNGAKWTVSSDPVKLYTFYEDGLINCSSLDDVETISNEEIEQVINKNILENIRFVELENKVNNSSAPCKTAGFMSIGCG